MPGRRAYRCISQLDVGSFEVSGAGERVEGGYRVVARIPATDVQRGAGDGGDRNSVDSDDLVFLYFNSPNI